MPALLYTSSGASIETSDTASGATYFQKKISLKWDLRKDIQRKQIFDKDDKNEEYKLGSYVGRKTKRLK